MAVSKVFVVDRQDGVLIITPLRNISSLGEDEVQAQWDDIVAEVNREEIRHVVFDFEKVDYFGSSMLEAMLYLWKRIRPHDGKMAVCNVSETAGEILRLSRFDTLWPICATRDEALQYVRN